MKTEEQPSLDDWTDFAGDFLKADFIDGSQADVVVIGVEGVKEDTGRNRLFLEVEYADRQWKFDINKTNQTFLRNNGVKKPKDLISYKLTLQKIKVRNPSTNSMQDGLAIVGISA